MSYENGVDHVELSAGKKDVDRGIVDPAKSIPSPPPDAGYGWICLMAFFCVNAFTWGVVAVSKFRGPQRACYV